MGTQIVPADKQNGNKKVSLKELLRQPEYTGRFKEVLGDRAPQFVSSIISVANTFDKPVEPKSVINAAMQAATLDLPVNKDLGYAWIVPYNGVAAFQMGARGYVQLALRTGQYKTINVTEIREGELRSYNKLTGEFEFGETAPDTSPVIGYAAYFRLLNGFEKAAYWPMDQVKAHAKRFSQSFRKGTTSPWQTDFDAMAKKTVLKALLAKWGILSVQMQDAISGDHGTRDELDADVRYVDNQQDVIESDENKSRADKLGDELMQQFEQPPGTQADVIDAPPPKVQEAQLEPPPAQQPQSPVRKTMTGTKERFGTDSPSWAKFNELRTKFGHNLAIEAKDQLGWINTPFDRLSTKQLDAIIQNMANAELDKELAETNRTAS